MGGLVQLRLVFALLLLISSLSCANEAGWLGRVSPLELNSDAEAHALAHDLVAKFQEADPHNLDVDVVHIKGVKVSPHLGTVLMLLSAAGYKIHGSFVDEDRIKEIQIRHPEVQLAYSTQSFVDDRGLWKRLFGLPQGLTFFAHFFKGGSWRFRYPFNGEIFRFAATATGLAALTTVIMRTLVLPWVGQPVPAATELVVTTSMLSAWIFFFLETRREWSDFRTQGYQLEERPDAEAGQQLGLGPNSRFFTTTCIAQEHVLSAIIVGTLMAFGAMEVNTTREAVELAAKTSVLSIVSALSYTSFEEVMAAKLKEAAGVAASDAGKAKEINRQVTWLSTIFYNVLYPIANYTGRFIPGIFSLAPLGLLGVGSWKWKDITTTRRVTTQPAKISSKRIPCAAIVALRQ